MTQLAGTAAGQSKAELIRFFSKAQLTGTLVMQRRSSASFCLLENGRVRHQREVGDFGDGRDLDYFTWRSHELTSLPHLEPARPDSAVAALRALPLLGSAAPVRNAVTDLPALLDQLRDEQFTGALLLLNGNEAGLALLTDGLIRAAAVERDGYVWQRVDALRAMQRHSLDASLTPLLLQPLDAITALGLAGIMLDARAATDSLEGYSGVASDDTGYSYYLEGRPYLHVRAEPLVAGVRCTWPTGMPDLRLPQGKPGWERERYALTLRGQDALIPMAELSMWFEQKHGDTGRTVLLAFRKGGTVEDVAVELHMDLSAIRDILQRLLDDGLVRIRKS